MDVATRQNLTGLMTRLADGDRSAFDAVYAGLWPVLSAFCSKTLAACDAEDAAQQALLKVFDQASNFDRDRDALTWALSIAVWEVRTIRKRHQRSKTSALGDVEFTAESDNPETLVVDRQITSAARHALGQLSVSDQETLLATFNEDAPAGIAGATFRKRRERALVRLKDVWRRIYAG